jgi:2-phospho-L-lactate guanylyltransferase
MPVTRIVVPFAGADGKSRLRTSQATRHELALAMLGDVLEACVEIGPTLVVTDDPDAAAVAEAAGARTAGDPGGGQGAAVQAALAGLAQGPLLVVNADLPCLEPGDLLALVEATPAGGLALAEAADGTTNALSLSASTAFAPLYGSGSAARFHARAVELGIESVTAAIPNLVDDVDTIDDLARLASRCGPRTRASLGDRCVEAVQ